MSRFIKFASFFAILVLFSSCAPESTGVVAPLLIDPIAVGADMLSNSTFTVTGGIAPYVFRVLDGGGTIDENTGAFVAPNQPGTVLIEARDSAGRSSIAVVTVVHDATSARYLAVGSGGDAFYSIDGLSTWIMANSVTGSYLEAATFDNGVVVAVGDSGTVMHSSDKGVSWSAAASGTKSKLYDVAADGGGRFVAAGKDGAVIYSAVGGASWSSGSSGTSNTLRAVAHDGVSRFVVVGSSGTAVYSVDGGATWTTGISGVTQTLEGLAYDGVGRFMAVGSNGTAIYSNDGGANWTAATSVPSGTADYEEVVSVTPNTWVAVGTNGDEMYTVDNGANWLATTSTNTSRDYKDVYNDGLRLVAVGEDGVVSVSTDNGVSWADIGIAPAAISLNGILYIP